MSVFRLFVLGLLLCCGGVPGPVPGTGPGAVDGGEPPSLAATFSNATSVLWVGAHPDDELYAAPLLDVLCRRQHKPCQLLVLTDGAKGNCSLPGGCLPDIAAIRRGELEASAAYFDARLERWDLEDAPAGSATAVLAAWSANDAGDVVARVEAVLGALPPGALLVTFDPRHGSSCHSDHRAAATAAVLAAQRVGFPLTALVMTEVRPIEGHSDDGGTWVGFAAVVPSDPAVRAYPALESWSAVKAVLDRHPSQFSPALGASFSSAPSAQRIQPLLAASDALSNDSRYEVCP
jgi:LmbE family N-acetylglucosaminyl deacetylase